MEGGRDPQKQSSINSVCAYVCVCVCVCVWSLQPHCGNFDCGPQITREGFNLWRHLRLQLIPAALVYVCFSGKRSRFHLFDCVYLLICTCQHLKSVSNC